MALRLAYLALVRVPRARTTQEDRCGAGLSAQEPWHPLSDLKDAAEVQRATLWVGAHIRDDRIWLSMVEELA